MVQIGGSAFAYDGYYVVDTAPPISSLVCKKPATLSAYDACSKFEQCT